MFERWLDIGKRNMKNNYQYGNWVPQFWYPKFTNLLKILFCLFSPNNFLLWLKNEKLWEGNSWSNFSSKQHTFFLYSSQRNLLILFKWNSPLKIIIHIQIARGKYISMSKLLQYPLFWIMFPLITSR